MSAKTRICSACGRRKSVDAFYRLFKDSDARQSKCKPCDNAARVGRQYDAKGTPAIIEVRFRGQVGDSYHWTRSEAWEAAQLIRRKLRGA